MTFEQRLMEVREQVITIYGESAPSRSNIRCKGTKVGTHLPALELLRVGLTREGEGGGK